VPPGPGPVRVRPAVAAHRPGAGRDKGERSRQAVAQVDPGLVERPARVLPGAVGVLAGRCGTAGCAATAWWAGAVPPFAAEA
ncbi:SPFH domain-containing protein, partial [Streptomyces pilosus]